MLTHYKDQAKFPWTAIVTPVAHSYQLRTPFLFRRTILVFLSYTFRHCRG